MFTSAFALVAFLAQAPSGPAAAPSADAVSQAYMFFIQGRTLESRDDHAGAAAALRKALEILPNAAEIHAEMAVLLARQGQASASIAEATTALKSDPNSREANRILGLVQAQVVDTVSDPARRTTMMNEAIGHLEVAVADRLVDPAAMFTLGQLYLQSDQFAKAAATFQLFLLDQPDYPDALVMLGESYFQLKRYRDAADTWDRALAGDRSGMDVAAITRKRDRARELAK
jgi:tetratricopeptide (TPR) repeat protein